MNRRRKRNKRKKIIIFSIILCLIGAGGYAGNLYFKTKNTLEDIYVPIVKQSKQILNKVGTETTEAIAEEIKMETPISVLLLGIDGAGEEHSRSDSLIVLTMNPNSGKTTMTSIPRDSLTEIVGNGTEDKINHAHAFGGPQMAIDTVEDFLGISIDYFVSVDMKGFKDVVDIFKGVSVMNEFNFSYDGHTFQEGTITLNGEEALAFVRMRKEDPRGDIGRNDRQKQVIESLMQKAASMSSISKVKELLDMISNNVKTNIQISDASMFQQLYAQANGNIETLSLKGSGQTINNVWYFIPDEASKSEVSEKLQTELMPKDPTAIVPDDEFSY